MNTLNGQPPIAQVAQQVESRPVTLNWIRDGRVAVFKINGPSTRSTVDEWFNMVADLVKSWPAEKLYLALQDFSDKRVSLTPYMSSRTKEFEPLAAHLHGRVAIVLPNTLGNQIFRMFMRTLAWQQKLPTEAFVSYDSAMRWLDAALNKENQAKPDASMQKPDKH